MQNWPSHISGLLQRKRPIRQAQQQLNDLVVLVEELEPHNPWLYYHLVRTLVRLSSGNESILQVCTLCHVAFCVATNYAWPVHPTILATLQLLYDCMHMPSTADDPAADQQGCDYGG